MRVFRSWLFSNFLVLALLAGAELCAQSNPYNYPDSLLIALDDDSVRFVRAKMPDGTYRPASHYVSGYEFQMYADTVPTCETDYTISAFKINGQRWKLKDWKWNRIVNTNAELLTAGSRTVEQVVRAGDTVTFYRSLDWMDPRIRRQDTTNYVSPDTLTFAVELVNAATGVRAALLDTLGVLPRTTPGAPTFHGMRPILSDVKWVVPSSLDSVSVFARVRVNAGGLGVYDFTRRELNMSVPYPYIKTAYGNAYRDYFDRRFLSKPSLESIEAVAGSALLRLRTAAGKTELVTMEFTTAPDGGSTSVAIYDGAGQLVFTPYTSASSNGANARAEYRFESSGLYLVCLVHNGYLVATQTITIGR